MAVLSVKTAPAIEPLSLYEAKLHLRITTTDEDAFVQRAIRAARRNLEQTYNRAMLTQTLVLTLDRFQRAPWPADAMYTVTPMAWTAGLGVTWSMIELRPPVQSITSVKYIDPSGVQQTMSSLDYAFQAGSESSVGRLYPALNKIWPAVALLPGAIQIEFVTGFTTAALVPEDWKAATELYVGHIYENREQVVLDARAVAVELPHGIDALMGAYGQVLMA